MNLHDLTPARGAKKRRKRIGRGPGSGHGKTATKGHKGLKARSGGAKRPGFEGGQMPLVRRLPKFGFTNPFRAEFNIINVKSFESWAGPDMVTPQALVDAGMVKRKSLPIKILGNGEVKRALVIQAHKFSKAAAEKIQAAGGRVEVIGGV
ncbi:50S ribosomal protein L15 [Nitrospira sp. NS4]|uniref:50S ribosomal protein L15 n=1 Tax=Nitrospira sp. NS4 TaxID=3414498 RepID=UPI003C30639D